LRKVRNNRIPAALPESTIAGLGEEGERVVGGRKEGRKKYFLPCPGNTPPEQPGCGGCSVPISLSATCSNSSRLGKGRGEWVCGMGAMPPT